MTASSPALAGTKDRATAGRTGSVAPTTDRDAVDAGALASARVALLEPWAPNDDPCVGRCKSFGCAELVDIGRRRAGRCPCLDVNE